MQRERHIIPRFETGLVNLREIAQVDLSVRNIGAHFIARRPATAGNQISDGQHGLARLLCLHKYIDACAQRHILGLGLYPILFQFIAFLAQIAPALIKFYESLLDGLKSSLHVVPCLLGLI